MSKTKTCQTEGCTSPCFSGGLCRKHYSRQYLAANKARINELGRSRYRMQPDKKREAARRWRHANPGQARVAGANWRAANREKCRSFGQRFRDAHREQERSRARQKYYNNKEQYKANVANRRAKKLQATPPWADLEAIRQIYRLCPPGHHVDHIVPLQGKDVCGLHVPCNLQYLPAEENIRKGNRLREEDLRLIQAV